MSVTKPSRRLTADCFETVGCSKNSATHSGNQRKPLHETWAKNWRRQIDQKTCESCDYYLHEFSLRFCQPFWLVLLDKTIKECGQLGIVRKHFFNECGRLSLRAGFSIFWDLLQIGKFFFSHCSRLNVINQPIFLAAYGFSLWLNYTE